MTGKPVLFCATFAMCYVGMSAQVCAIMTAFAANATLCRYNDKPCPLPVGQILPALHCRLSMPSLRQKFDSSALASTRMTIVFALLASLAPLGMDSYLPAVQYFAASLGVTAEQASWTLSNFLIGLGVGQLVGGALSDQKGRRWVLLIGLAIYVGSCMAVVLLHNFYGALVFRFFQGAGAGFMSVCGIAMVKDTTAPDKLAERLALCFFVIMITPAVAPMIGSLILLVGPWPMIFLFCACTGLAMSIFVYFKIPETNLLSSGRLSLTGALQQYLYVVTLKTGGRLVALRMIISGSMGSSIILVFVTTAPSNLMGHYGLSSSQFPLAFACVIGAMLLGNRLGKFLLLRVDKARLFGMGLGLQLSLATVLLLITFFANPPVWLYLAIIMLGVGTFAAVGPGGQALYLNLMEKNYGSASAVDQMSRFSLGGLLGGLAASLPFPPLFSVALVLVLTTGLGFISFASVRAIWKVPG